MKFLNKHKIIKIYLLLVLSFFLSEVFFRYVMSYQIIDWATYRIFLVFNVLALILALIISLFNKIFERISVIGLTLAVGIYAICQIATFFYLGVFISFGTAGQAGAITEYLGLWFASFTPKYFTVMIGPVLVIIYYIVEMILNHKAKKALALVKKPKRITKKMKALMEAELKSEKKIRLIERIVLGSLILVSCGLFYMSLVYSKMQNPLQLENNKNLFINPSNPNISVNQFGTTVFVILDLKTTIFPVDNVKAETYVNPNLNPQVEVSVDYLRTIDDTAWIELDKNTSNKNYKTLNNYFMNRYITPKNDYTGMFEGKNVIFIMMESVNTLAINEEYFPNLYKIYNEGYAWDNAYSPRNACSTGNNEMSGMVSLYTIYRSCTYNNYKNNKYFESVFNLFNNKGYYTTSYHDYTDAYYYRNTIHPNMGSGKFYDVNKLGIKYNSVYKEWPSDVLLMQKASEIFLNGPQDKPFMAWITTVTSHQPYTVSSEFGDKYLDLYKDTKLPIAVQRYLSKLTEVDKAIGELLRILEENNKLNDTVLVLYADHYPYGIPTNQLQKAFDYSLTENYEIDRTPFIIYNPSITPEKKTQLTSYMNILPTLANLFNLDYDPRLYMGQDLFSETFNNRLVFADGSWQTDIAFYDATNGKIKYYGKETYTNEEIINNNKEIRDMIKMSNLAVTSDYFNYLGDGLKKYAVQTENQEN